MDSSKIVILGGGMVAGYAAKQLVELGLKPGELTILSADSSVPYERPPLSKGFLSGKDSEESIRINPENFYEEHGIDIRLNCHVTAIDSSRRRLSLQSGSKFDFEALVIATGSSARRLTIPGAKLANLYYLRSFGDSKKIRESIGKGKRAVIIGGGFIGMEVASVLAQKEVEVTMLIQEDRVWKQFFTPEMSAFFERYFEARGVRFLKEAKVSALGGSSAVESVQLAKGQSVPCDFVVAGIGATPVTDFLNGSGLEESNGVVVNEYLETAVSGIYAAGDVANYSDLIFGKRRRVEHWDNAVSQGQHCAKLLMGQRSPFKHVPYFFSDVFDLSYELWGDPSENDQIIHRGDLSSSSFSVWWLRKGAVTAAFVMNRPGEERDLAQQWIEVKHIVSNTASLADVTVPI